MASLPHKTLLKVAFHEAALPIAPAKSMFISSYVTTLATVAKECPLGQLFDYDS
ncbi:MAG: hypothetical protein AAB425_11300 [Bdellovibrionota bacterium]